MKKFLWFVGIVVLVFVLVSIFSAPSLDREKYELEGANIAVIEIEGVIMEALPVLEQIHKIKKNNQIKGVLVRVDSPGGAVGASQEVYLALKNLREQVPVVVSMGNVAASGGLYVTLGANKIFALPGTLTGSVGVLLQMTNVSKAFEKLYLEPVTIKSGELKDAGNPTQPLQEEARDYLKSVILQTFDQFRRHVVEERSLEEAAVKRLSDGRVVDGIEAKDLGLVDEIGTFDDAVAFLRETANIQAETKFAWVSRKRPSLTEYLFPEIGTFVDQLNARFLEPRVNLEYRLK